MAICGDSMSVRALKLAFRKHAKGDDCIGWDELSEELSLALTQIMGPDDFCEWVESLG